MGLLDFLGTGPEDPRSQASLMFAQGLLGGRGMQGLTTGLMGYNAVIEARRRQAQEEEQQAMRRKLLEAQVGETQAQAAQRMAMIEEAKAKRAEEIAAQNAQAQFVDRVRQSAITPQADALAMGGGPTVAAGQVVGTPRSPNWGQLALENPQFIPMLKQMAEAQNYGRPKVARTIEGSEGNRPATMQMDDFGNIVGKAIPKAVEAKLMDQGGRQVAYDPFNLQAGASFEKVMTPAEKASNAIAMSRLALDQGKEAREAASGGKAPAGYRFKADGSLEAIPGGPADIKAGELGAKREKERENIEHGAAGVLDTVADAKKLAGAWTTGLGGVLSAIPATPARNLKAKVESIKANLGFDRLQEMRNASPTGGALGQVAVQELVALQSTVASLDQLQSPSEFLAAMNKIERHYKRWQEVAGSTRSGGASGSFGDDKASQSGAPKPGTVIRGYRFKGGDPSDRNNWEQQ